MRATIVNQSLVTAYVNVFSSGPRFDEGNSAIVTYGQMYIDPAIHQELCTRLAANNSVHIIPTSLPNHFKLMFSCRSSPTVFCGHACLAATKFVFDAGYAFNAASFSCDYLKGSVITATLDHNSTVKITFPQTGFGSFEYLPPPQYFAAMGVEPVITYRNELGDCISIVEPTKPLYKYWAGIDTTALEVISKQLGIRGSGLTMRSTRKDNDYDVVYTAPTCGIEQDICVSFANSLALLWHKLEGKNDIVLDYTYQQRTSIPCAIGKDSITILGKTHTVFSGGSLRIEERL